VAIGAPPKQRVDPVQTIVAYRSTDRRDAASTSASERGDVRWLPGRSAVARVSGGIDMTNAKDVFVP
jgi:hypothetical protein